MKHYSSGLHSPSTSFPSKFWGCSSGPFIEATGDRRMHEFKRWVRVCFVDEPIRHRISILGIFTVPLDFKTRIEKRIHEIKLDLQTTNLLRLGCEILEAKWFWKCILRRIWSFSDGLGLDRVLGESNLESKKMSVAGPLFASLLGNHLSLRL